MATGGFCRVKKCMSETKGRSSNWSRSSKPDKDEVLSPSSFPSDVRVNHWVSVIALLTVFLLIECSTTSQC